MSKVTNRSTKEIIWQAYQDALKELKDKEKELHNPQAIKETEAKQEIVKSAEKIKTATLSNILSKIQSDMEKANSELESYKEINEAIKIKEAELKKLFDIENSALALTSLVNAQLLKKESFETELKAKEEELSNKIAETEKLLSDREIETDKAIKEKQKNFNDGLKKIEDEWKYSFERNKLIEKNKFQDELEIIEKAKNKEFEEKELEIATRLKEITLRESEVEKLVNEIDTLKTKLITQEEEITKTITEKLNTSKDYQIRFIKRDYEGKIELLENKVEIATTQIQSQKEEIASLNIKLDEAYKKLENLATKTVEGASNTKMISSLEQMVRQQQNNNGK